MLTTPHIFVGAAVGKAVNNMYLALPFAFLSHYILDMIPHYAPHGIKSYKENGLWGTNKLELIVKASEPLLGVYVLFQVAAMVPDSFAVIISSAFAAWFPDFLGYLEWKHGIKVPKHHPSDKWHKHVSFVPGTIPQIIVTWYSFVYLTS